MCGISGVYHFNSKKADKGFLKSMNDRISHRGPDDSGYYIENNVGLAHRRLSIIDLNTGKQPITNKDSTITVIYNGEIYNYKELRSELEKKGYVFRTKTDTEIIVHAYDEYGPKCIEKFNGMFAFALYDKKKKELIIARDRLGIKPIYYFKNNEKFMFSSEIKGILADKSIKREPNNKAIADYMTFQNILDDKTFFKDIKKLLPGHYAIISKKEKMTITQYWDAHFNDKKIKKDKEILHEYKNILDKSVKRHLMSDVALGGYLSGGFDSSSVCTIASKYIKNFHTFTGSFDEGPKYTEILCSSAVAKKIGAKKHEIILYPKDYIKNIRKIVYHLDEPTVGTGSFPQYMVAGLVAKHAKVVLTGHGGDEFFAGYQAFKAAYYKELIKKNPLNAIRLLYGVKPSEIARVLYFFFYPIIQKEVKYGLIILFDKRSRKKLFTKDFQKELKGYDPIDSIESLLRGKNLKGADMVQYLYMKTYLPTLFILEDKVSMAHSIEARTPICDNEMVDFSLRTNMKNKLFNDELKHIPKQAMRGELPDILYSQPKKGFPTPFSKWYKNELKDFARDVLLSKKAKNRNIFNMRYIEKLLDSHAKSRTDNLYDYVRAFRIYSLITVELWFRIFIDGEKV